MVETRICQRRMGKVAGILKGEKVREKQKKAGRGEQKESYGEKNKMCRGGATGNVWNVRGTLKRFMG
jgi:hypothetical protein